MSQFLIIFGRNVGRGWEAEGGTAQLGASAIGRWSDDAPLADQLRGASSVSQTGVEAPASYMCSGLMYACDT